MQSVLDWQGMSKRKRSALPSGTKQTIPIIISKDILTLSGIFIFGFSQYNNHMQGPACYIDTFVKHSKIRHKDHLFNLS